MTVYLLPPDRIAFPGPEEAEADGLLAVGGDLSVPRLLVAYARGIFPWYNEDTPILWWSPDPRLVLEPAHLRVPRRLARFLADSPFTLTMDTAFDRVIQGCADARRPGNPGTWIVPDMIEAFIELHRAGFAHSVEAWAGDELAGGLYGVSLGRAFFGESMFHAVPNASKAALVALCRQLEAWEFDFIDCQQTTPHLLRFGAREIPRLEFTDWLQRALEHPTMSGPWR